MDALSLYKGQNSLLAVSALRSWSWNAVANASPQTSRQAWIRSPRARSRSHFVTYRMTEKPSSLSAWLAVGHVSNGDFHVFCTILAGCPLQVLLAMLAMVQCCHSFDLAGAQGLVQALRCECAHVGCRAAVVGYHHAGACTVTLRCPACQQPCAASAEPAASAAAHDR